MKKTINLKVKRYIYGTLKGKNLRTIEYYVNDTLFMGLFYELSRILTNTELETDMGIFSESPNGVEFRRGGISVMVYFKPFDFLDLNHSSFEIMEEIKKRVKSVNDAFDLKKISTTNICEENFEID